MSAWTVPMIALLGVGMMLGVLFHTAAEDPPDASCPPVASSTVRALHCEEDEVAVHGGLENYYDPNAPLECVALDDFEEKWR